MENFPNTIHILLVEDNPADVEFTQEAFDFAKVVNKLSVAEDGQEALDFLNEANDSRDLPDLILLDLNLPRMNGHEFLQIIKEDKRFKQIPVIVLTSSEAETDIVSAYGLHANAYLTKPVGFDNFLKIVTSIENFWLCAVKLP